MVRLETRTELFPYSLVYYLVLTMTTGEGRTALPRQPHYILRPELVSSALSYHLKSILPILLYFPYLTNRCCITYLSALITI